MAANAKTAKKPRLEIIHAAAENAIQSLWNQHGANALKEYRRRRKDKRPSSMADRLTDVEARLLYGLIEARLCYHWDARHLGELTAVTLQRTPFELCGIGEAVDIIGDSRQMIQYWCETGYLAAMRNPYDDRWLIVRKSAKEMARVRGSREAQPPLPSDEPAGEPEQPPLDPQSNGTPFKQTKDAEELCPICQQPLSHHDNPCPSSRVAIDIAKQTVTVTPDGAPKEPTTAGGLGQI